MASQLNYIILQKRKIITPDVKHVFSFLFVRKASTIIR